MAACPAARIASLPGGTVPIAHAVRGHRGIENRVLCVSHVAFRGDASLAHGDYGAENLALPRKLALDLLRAEPTPEHGVKASRLRADWDNAYPLRVLGAQ